MSFGPIKPSGAVERGAEAVLTTWLPYYLAEAARQDGLEAGEPYPAEPRTIETFTRPDTWMEHQLPAVIVVSPGTDGEADTDGRGRVSAWWRLGVWAVVGASDQDATRRLAHRYAAAIRACLVSHRTLGGVAERLTYRGERYDEAATDQARTLTMVGVEFRVRMVDIAGQGPVVLPTPTPDPHDPWPPDPQVTSTHVNTTGEAP